MTDAVQRLAAEALFADELSALAAHDPGPRPPGWALTPRAVVRFLVGSEGRDGPAITRKFVGPRAVVERCVVTLAGPRGLLLVGEPGTAKSMLSEWLAAAVCGHSTWTVQGTAGTTEEHLRYGWNYGMLLASGPTREALVRSPVAHAMEHGGLARVEEITRCLPEVQDALVSLLSERHLAIPELGTSLSARPGFNVIATANLRDRGVSEMSAALKRRFNVERIDPIADLGAELALVRSQAHATMAAAGADRPLDETLLETLVTVFRDLRHGATREGWQVERPNAVLSTAEAIAVATGLGLQATYLRDDAPLDALPGHLLGVVAKDDDQDRVRLLAYWDHAVKRRADEGNPTWSALWAQRDRLEDGG